MRAVAAFLVVAVLLGTQAAWAAKPSIVAKVPGSAFVLRADPSSSYLAAWSAQPDGKFTLMVIDGDKGTRSDVVTVENPGGMCWIPTRGRLLYCKGNFIERTKTTNVTYYYYDVTSAKSTKIIDLIDSMDTWQLDPEAAEDGSTVFVLTMDQLSGGAALPGFNTYIPEANLMTRNTVDANMGTDYDLSSDGTKVFWYLHNPDNGNFNIIGWDLQTGYYSDVYEFGAKRDPAQDHALFRLDSTRQWAATAAVNETDPTLQLCVYNFRDNKNLSIIPVRLAAGEEVMYFDWKGRSGELYVLSRNSKTKEYSLLEIDPLEGGKRELLRLKDEITLVDYSPKAQTYYYSVVDNRNPSKPLTSLIRVR